MLAARQLSNRPFMVFALGTAGTADFIDDQGVHKGGFIVPGLRLMTEALFDGTADVHVAFEASKSLAPGTSTPSAVRRGVVLMLADFVNGSIRRFGAMCTDTPLVYLSGGDADVVAPLVDSALEILPELVLDGLALALP
jgi:type III pantothenate kinase